MRLLSQRWRSDGAIRDCCCYCMIDVILAILVGVLCSILFIGFIPPYKRGFYCDDRSIHLPYKPNTISVTALLTISIAVPILVIIWYQVWTFLIPISSSSSSCANNHNNSTPSKKHGGGGGIVNLSERIRVFFAIGTSVGVEYFFGLMVVVALMHFGKSAFGVLRPHFIDVCRPNASFIQTVCSSTTTKKTQSSAAKEIMMETISVETSTAEIFYVEEPYCTTKDYYQLKVARESFPSGHSAVSVYATFFILCLIHDRAGRSRSSPYGRAVHTFCPSLVRFAFSAVCILWTTFVCVSRVTDHWHHWTDVAGGIGLGAGVGAVMFFRKDSAFRNSLTQCKVMDY